MVHGGVGWSQQRDGLAVRFSLFDELQSEVANLVSTVFIRSG